jgi:hypothetical protein
MDINAQHISEFFKLLVQLPPRSWLGIGILFRSSLASPAIARSLSQLGQYGHW